MAKNSKNPPDYFCQFSAILSDLVDAFQKNEKKENLELILLEMDFLAEKIGGEIFGEYVILKEIFAKENFDKKAFLNQCLKLKNQLWEL